MDCLKQINSLWGSTIYNLEIDLLLQRSKFYIRIVENNILKFYELDFEGVLNFNINNKNILPWHYIELTEIYAKKEESYKFDLMLWNETHTINIICKKWKLNLIKEFNENS